MAALPLPGGAAPAVTGGAGPTRRRRTALFLSPHLDDAVFSAGATMAQLADAGWRVVMATAFTRSVPDPRGFALACQLDKGVPADLDYMALRRTEDLEAARALGTEVRWLDLPEAPHRGYGSAAALFADVQPGDMIVQPLAAAIESLLAELRPDLVLTCQGLGGHVDHRQVIRAVLRVLPASSAAAAAAAAGQWPGPLFWRDTPYVIRAPVARPDPALPATVLDTPDALQAVDAGAGLDRKVIASCAYASQIGFQFGGAEACGRALRALAASEKGERFAGVSRLSFADLLGRAA